MKNIKYGLISAHVIENARIDRRRFLTAVEDLVRYGFKVKKIKKRKAPGLQGYVYETKIKGPKSSKKYLWIILSEYDLSVF